MPQNRSALEEFYEELHEGPFSMVAKANDYKGGKAVPRKGGER